MAVESNFIKVFPFVNVILDSWTFIVHLGPQKAFSSQPSTKVYHRKISNALKIHNKTSYTLKIFMTHPHIRPSCLFWHGDTAYFPLCIPWSPLCLHVTGDHNDCPLVSVRAGIQERNCARPGAGSQLPRDTKTRRKSYFLLSHSVTIEQDRW